MGCGGSKADEAKLVALCRERKDHVRAAADYRYAMAASHVAYFDSLRAVGEAILRFVEEDLVVGPPPESSSSSSPVLTLPRDGKKKNKKPKPKLKPGEDGVSSSTTSISHSAEDHHHHEHDDVDDDDDDLEDSHLHLTSSPSSSGSGRGAAHFGGGEESGYGNVGAGGSRRYPHPVEERGYGDFGSGGGRYFYPPPEAEEERGPLPQGGGWGGGARFGEVEEYGNVGPSYHYQEEGGGALPSQGSWGGGYGYPETENQYASSYPFPGTTYGNPSFGAYYMRKAPTPARTVVYDDPNTRGFSRSDYYGGDASGGGGGGNYYGNGFFGYPPTGMMGGYPSQPPRREPSPERKPPPPPPSPPRPSTWDFLNVFEAAGGGPDGYFYPAMGHGYGSTTSSPDSKEVREREGIPELEDETESEVLKEVYSDKNSKRKKKKVGEEVHYGNVRAGSRFSEETGRNFGEGTSKAGQDPVVNGSRSGSLGSGKGEGVKSSASPDTFRSPESIVTLSPEEDEEIAQFVKKRGVSFEVEEVAPTDLESSKVSSLTTLSNQGTRDLQEVAREIRSEFESATGYGKEVAVMLEVGKLPYQRRTALLKVIVSRILFLVSSHPPTRPSIHISSRTMKMAKAYSGEPGTDFDMDAKNLSSTLQQLYVWEKKLYKEVKDEERLRLMYDKMCKRLQNLDARGAESTKIDATRVSIRKLLTKINVNIRAINAISRKIHRLRDEELMPQITELIHSLIRMWKSMLRCHHKQFQAIMESKIRYLRANTGLQGDSGLKATIDLENELINWCTRFNKWISSQKLYVQSLNEWLSRCLNHETEETADGPAPFSPSRVGAPPIFVICNDWHHAMTAISEKVVENTMIDFASKLHQLWEQQDEEKRQRNKAEYVRKDFEKRLRDLRLQRGITEEDHDASSDKTMSKVASDSGVSRLDDLKVDLDMMSKKLKDERIRHKEASKLVHLAASSSVQGGLVPIFESLGKFSSEVLKAHENVRLQYVPDDGGP